MKTRKLPFIPFLCIWTMLTACSPTISEQPYENTCMPQMDYDGLYVFNCQNDTKYPLQTDRSLKMVRGEADLLDTSKSHPVYCIIIDNASLWLEDSNKCLDINDLPFNFTEHPSLSVIGYYTGEKEKYFHYYDQFMVVEIRDYDHICCNICCNPESEYFSDRKKCFWYLPGKEKPFPYESIGPFSFLANAVLRFGGG